MNQDPRTVSELGEAGTLERIRAHIGNPPAGEVWSGDDTAVIGLAPGDGLLTTDAMVEGVDFDFAYCAPADVGFKVVAINVSDIAAMGGRPTHAVAILALPPSTPVSRVDGIAAGLMEAAGRWEVALVGGDLSRAREMSIGLAMLGTPPASGPILRSGARPGDVIFVTGYPGRSAAGMALLRSGDTGHELLARAHLRPEPSVEAARVLAESGASALIDISDGLAIDLFRLLSASGVGCEASLGGLEDEALEAAGLNAAQARRVQLLGGEDFGLMGSMDADRFAEASALVAATGTPCRRLGTVTRTAMMVDGVDLEELKEEAWDHLLNR